MSGYETTRLNKIIRGLISFRKCPNCDSEGVELQYWSEDGEPCMSDTEGATRYKCEDCDGLGFIEKPSN